MGVWVCTFTYFHLFTSPFFHTPNLPYPSTFSYRLKTSPGLYGLRASSFFLFLRDFVTQVFIHFLQLDNPFNYG
jgi:hypothetical protein